MYLPSPLKGTFTITSHFGMRKHPLTGEWKFHKGIDVAMPIGTTIYAPCGGRLDNLQQLQDNKLFGYGNFCQVFGQSEQGTKFYVLFGHLSKFLQKDDSTIIANTPIALSGNTGSSSGPHCHIGLFLWDGRSYIPVDPLKYIHFA